MGRKSPAGILLELCLDIEVNLKRTDIFTVRFAVCERSNSCANDIVPSWCPVFTGSIASALMMFRISTRLWTERSPPLPPLRGGEGGK